MNNAQYLYFLMGWSDFFSFNGCRKSPTSTKKGPGRKHKQGHKRKEWRIKHG